MIWGCMSGLGVGQVYRCKGPMRQYQYIRVLRNHMLPSATVLYGQGQAFVFQQDNAPCHKARRVCAFFERSGVEVLDWPAQSPDLNTIEHLWEVLFRKVQNKKPSNLDVPWQLLQETWVTIPADTIQHLVHSMPRRCADVIAAKGQHTCWHHLRGGVPQCLPPFLQQRIRLCQSVKPGGKRRHLTRRMHGFVIIVLDEYQQQISRQQLECRLRIQETCHGH